MKIDTASKIYITLATLFVLSASWGIVRPLAKGDTKEVSDSTIYERLFIECTKLSKDGLICKTAAANASVVIMYWDGSDWKRAK